MSLSDPHILRRIRLALVLAWLALGLAVLAGSLLPNLGPSSFNIPLPHADKVVHFGAWALLACVVPFLVLDQRRRVAAAVGLFLLSGAVEIAQSIIPARSGSLADLAANGLGVLAGLAAGMLAAGFLARRYRPVATGLAFDAEGRLFASTPVR